MSVPALPDPAAADGLVLGVVIDVPEPAAGELRARREQIGDPQAEAIPAHVTLLPPTAVDRAQVRGVEHHLDKVAAALAPFEVRLDGVGTFRPTSPVVYVRVADGGDAFDEAQRAVRTGPLARDLYFPFHPHVTVAHKLDDAALDRAMNLLDGYRCAFVVEEFVLYEQRPDGAWRPRRRYAFGGGR